MARPGSLLLAACCAVAASCASVTIDLSDLRQPVMLNSIDALRALRATDGSARGLDPVKVDTWEASVGLRNVQYPYGSVSTRTDDAQAVAFEQIGGLPLRAIADVRLYVASTAVFGLVWSHNAVKVLPSGDVVDLLRRAR
jgi:hypothetical protein